MATEHPINLLASIKPDSIRVHAPTSIIFLCGGVIDATLATATKLRDAFYRVAKVAALKYKIVLAKDAKPLTTEAGYSDLFSFESDIAQVVGLILLFVESPGSFAELGAFAALETVAPSLLAVIDDYYYDRGSFIKNGPIRFLENRYGEEWILVLDRKEVGIAPDESIADLNLSNFTASIFPAVERQLAARTNWSKFERENNGHCILLIVGLCQEFGALRLGEIKQSFSTFGLSSTTETRLVNYIYCAQLLGWLKKVRKGNHIFYVAMPGESALEYSLLAEISYRDKIRRRADIRAYWKVNDAPRWRVIADASAESAGVS